ncbi:hypothetical protein [Actinomycetospora atypica]|uniref:Secreted protein n=1 Tax=Actinomycetospora atypica TaxID=1290095 RepID=A0ABV9YN52_9PSEU
MRRLAVALAALVLLPFVPGTASAAPATGAAEDCGVRVNRPHFSRQYQEIHTRIESFCLVPAMANTVSGRTYRLRFWGWELVGESAPVTTKPPGAFVQNNRETVTAPCEPGSRYRYRTEAFGTVVLPNGTYSASAYEQNDQEIQCS